MASTDPLNDFLPQTDDDTENSTETALESHKGSQLTTEASLATIDMLGVLADGSVPPDIKNDIIDRTLHALTMTDTCNYGSKYPNVVKYFRLKINGVPLVAKGRSRDREELFDCWNELNSLHPGLFSQEEKDAEIGQETLSTAFMFFRMREVSIEFHVLPCFMRALLRALRKMDANATTMDVVAETLEDFKMAFAVHGPDRIVTMSADDNRRVIEDTHNTIQEMPSQAMTRTDYITGVGNTGESLESLWRQLSKTTDNEKRALIHKDIIRKNSVILATKVLQPFTSTAQQMEKMLADHLWRVKHKQCGTTADTALNS